jgi:hypothetical protein
MAESDALGLCSLLIDVGGSAEAGLAPGLLAQRFRELVLQLPEAGGLARDLAVSVGQIGLQRGPAHRRAAVVGGRGIGLGGVDLLSRSTWRLRNVRSTPAARAIAETLISAPSVLAGVDGLDDALATAGGVGLPSFDHRGCCWS